jgi:hypothetical protein
MQRKNEQGSECASLSTTRRNKFQKDMKKVRFYLPLYTGIWEIEVPCHVAHWALQRAGKIAIVSDGVSLKTL